MTGLQGQTTCVRLPGLLPLPKQPERHGIYRVGNGGVLAIGVKGLTGA